MNKTGDMGIWNVYCKYIVHVLDFNEDLIIYIYNQLNIQDYLQVFKQMEGDMEYPLKVCLHCSRQTQ